MYDVIVIGSGLETRVKSKIIPRFGDFLKLSGTKLDDGIYQVNAVQFVITGESVVDAKVMVYPEDAE